MANITRKSEKTVASVSSSARKISVNVTEKLTIAESKELRALLKEHEKKAASQSVFSLGTFYSPDPVSYTWRMS